MTKDDQYNKTLSGFGDALAEVCCEMILTASLRRFEAEREALRERLEASQEKPAVEHK
jgi:hypothetical protein